MQQADTDKLREEDARFLALTPTERFEITCRKLDRIRAKVRSDPIAREKYLLYKAARERERELFRNWWKQLGEAGKPFPQPAWENYPSLDELFPDI